MGGIL
jgi:hypothetical protein